jgi:hypothetical protein
MPRAPRQKPKSQRGRPRLEGQRALYLIKVSRWDLAWSFSLACPEYSRVNEGHYNEHMVLTLRGAVVYPEDFKYPELECQLYADHLLSSDKERPLAIGSMSANGQRLMAYVAVHRERLSCLVAAAGRLSCLELSATPLHYRRGLIMNIHLRTEPEPDW